MITINFIKIYGGLKCKRFGMVININFTINFQIMISAMNVIKSKQRHAGKKIMNSIRD